MKTLQVLVRHGKVWDATCKRIASQVTDLLPSERHAASIDRGNKQWKKLAPAIRVCYERWTRDHALGRKLTDVPIEEVRQGVDATKTYIRALSESLDIIYRRKISIVGPSNWGKTSLVKSLISDKPSLVHPDDRTIGIDKFKLSFYQEKPDDNSVVHHNVTFWDFAGQNEYQVAHSLFFSRRAVYLVCIDLNAYVITFYKAEMMTGGEPMALSEHMNAFVESSILRWIRLILARQLNAEFQFIGTKNDLLRDVDEDALVDLRARLSNVLVIVQGIIAGEKAGITHLGDKRLLRMRVKPSVDITFVSCTQQESVDKARNYIIDLICQSERSYAMPESYSHALRIVKQMRKAAQAASPSSRVARCFVNVDELTSELAGSVSGVDQAECRNILHSLRGIGDLLWYKDVNDKTLRETVVLDPLLLIDLICKNFNHNQKSEVLYHADLKQLEVWKNINEDDDLLLAMKRLLHHFHLAHPTAKDNVMKWNSDLMLPASWRSKTSGQLMFMGQPLNHPYGVVLPKEWQVDVHWEIEIDSGFEEALFDHLVVATYQPAFMPRSVGPDYILYGDAYCDDTSYACRLIDDDDECGDY